ncbi:MAG: MGMT family protein, partial [Staphylococcus equorum]|nr:MGMT family protein [Staphylococcus equorum]
SGTEFREQVWAALLEIPYGKTVTYGEIAQIIGKKRGKTQMSSQAVGGAVGNNPISIIIPCHRVVGKDGSLTGYGGGIDTKIELLKLEKMDMDAFYRPKYSTKP